MSPAPYCTVGMPWDIRMLPSPTLPSRPQPPTTAGVPVARRWPSASAVTRRWSGLVSIGSWNHPSSMPLAGIVISASNAGWTLLMEARPDAPDDLGLLLDRVHVLRPGLRAVPEEELGALRLDPHHDDADADVGDRVGGVLHVDGEVRAQALGHQRARAGAAELVGHHRGDHDVAAQADAGADDRLHGADRRYHAALVVVGAHAPHPAVLELGAVRIHAPAAHLHAGIHVTVQHEARPAAGAAQAPDGLARRLAGLGPVGDLHHFHVEPEVGHVGGEEIGDRAFLERRAGDADRGLLEGEHLRVADAREDLLPVGGVSHGSYAITNICSVLNLSESHCGAPARTTTMSWIW